MAAGTTVKVSIRDDGTLKTSQDNAIRWVETGPLSFREQDGLLTLGFREDEEGGISYMFYGVLPITAYERLGFLDMPELYNTLGTVSVFLFLITVILWPVAAITRWKHGVSLDITRRLPPSARMIVWCGCLVFLIFLLGLTVILGNAQNIAYGVPMSLKILLVLPILGGVLTVAAIVYTISIWKKRGVGMAARLHYSLVTVVFIAFLWYLHYWNLLGFQY